MTGVVDARKGEISVLTNLASHGSVGNFNVGISSGAEGIRGRVVDGKRYVFAALVVANVVAVAWKLLAEDRR